MRLPFLQVSQEGLARARTMARLLHIPEAHGVGIYVTLTAWALEMAPDGDLSGQLDDQDPAVLVAAAVGWDGDPVALLAAMERMRLVEPTSSGVRLASPRRVRAKPGAFAWAALHPGVPLPPSEPADLGPPMVRLLTPEERETKRVEREREESRLREEAAERRRLRMRRWVYFIQAETGGPIKIGISRDVERRRGELQRAERQPLKVLATIEGTIRDEGDLHHRFAAHRLHGEWFSPAPELLAHIAALNGRKA